VLAAILLDRTALSLRTLAWAALFLTALFPEAVFGPSFQMSFLAVLSLVALYEQAWVKVRWRDVNGGALFLRAVALYVAALIVTDLVAGGATALFAAYHFNRLPTYSLVANLFAVPITGAWIMPLGLVGLILMPLGLDRIPFEAMGAGVTLIDDIARTVAAWPGSQIHVPPMSTGVMVFAALGIVFACLWNGRMRWAGFAPVLVAVFQPMLSTPPDIVVDESARVFAVSNQEGNLVFKPGRTGRFVREVWTDRYGVAAESWPESKGEGDQLGLSCDSDACVMQRQGRRVLVAFRANAIAEDCGTADVIISAVAVRDLCRIGKKYDIIDFRRKGTHAIWFNEDGVRVRSAAESAGNRVWTR
jgi:competence protein ComEC